MVRTYWPYAVNRTAVYLDNCPDNRNLAASFNDITNDFATYYRKGRVEGWHWVLSATRKLDRLLKSKRVGMVAER